MTVYAKRRGVMWFWRVGRLGGSVYLAKGRGEPMSFRMPWWLVPGWLLALFLLGLDIGGSAPLRPLVCDTLAVLLWVFLGSTWPAELEG